MKKFGLCAVVILLLTLTALSQTVKTYTSTSAGFSAEYPSTFKVLTGRKAVADTAFGDPGRGKKVVTFMAAPIPQKYHGWYEFNIWISDDAADKCGIPVRDDSANVVMNSPESGPATRAIGGHTMHAYTGAEGGMSKSLGVNGFQGIVNGKCWQIQSMEYQVSAYDDFKSFDSKIIERAFEKFLSTFRFR